MQALVSEKTDIKEWFDNLVATIRSHEILLETNVASPELKKLYDLFFNNNLDELQKDVRRSNSLYFIQRVVLDYISEVRERTKGRIPNKLALQLSESQILVWAEIKDNDETTEDALLLAEAKINAKYSVLGFHISTTILEESDKFVIPEQFSNVF